MTDDEVAGMVLKVLQTLEENMRNKKMITTVQRGRVASYCPLELRYGYKGKAK